MAIKKINIEEFLKLAQTQPVFDVRSPGEYKQAHIPGANSLPLFIDEERAKVGTAYKQQSLEMAIKIGLDFFGVKMRGMVEEVEKTVTGCGLRVAGPETVSFATSLDFPKSEISNKLNEPPITRHPSPATILVHCWRGGMRSAAVAWLLDLYGFHVYTLAGGYKRYRNWVLEQFSKEYHFHVIGGYTGSGKTILLQELKENGHSIIDLEALADHKGSALGGLGKGMQPRTEMFENMLAGELRSKKSAPVIFIEDESQRIGDVQIPMPLWHTLRKSRISFIEIPFEERLEYLTKEYSVQPKEKLADAILRIQKRLGGLETKNAIMFLEEENFKECFRILLYYYDKYYLKGLYNREDAAELISTMTAQNVSPANIELILQRPGALHLSS